jgi:hypothetical protein
MAGSAASIIKPESVYVVDGKWQGGVQTAMEESLRKLRPRLVIPHHLLEVGHGLGAYGHDMGIRLRNQVPEGTRVQMLQWGESLSFSFHRKTMRLSLGPRECMPYKRRVVCWGII